MLLFLLLLAQSADIDRSPAGAPAPQGVHLDRHIDAHVPAREGMPAAGSSDDVAREPTPAVPAQGSGRLQEPPPPPVHSPRDPLYRDWR
jgi:hypothetical protein